MTEPISDSPAGRPNSLSVRLRDVVYKIKDRVILDLSLDIPSGRVVAIMGASGCGKSTLLNLIAGRIKPTSGTVDVDANRIGYVMQQDILAETDTVEESLEFVAAVSGCGDVDQVIEALDLSQIRQSVIGGNSRRGVSGGEKKRVAIAQTLLTQPELILLDEPTSGLDSHTASSVVDCLVGLVGVSVVMTIHQPSSDLFDKFGWLILLADAGVVYSGPPDEAIEWFSERGFRCPMYNNPADYFIRVLHESTTMLAIAPIDVPANVPRTATSRVATRSSLFIAVHASRFLRRMRRDPYTAKYRLLQNFVISLIYGLFFWQSKSNDSKLGALFYMVLYQGVIFSFMSAISSFPPEVNLVMREQLTSGYNLVGYIIAKTIMEFPLSLLCCILFTSVVNFMIDLAPVEKFPELVFVNLLGALVGQSWGYLVTSTFRSLEVINAVTPIMIPFVIMGGYFTTEIPIGAIWMYDLSFIRWTFQAMVDTVFDQTTTEKYNSSDVYSTSVAVLIGQFFALKVLSIVALTWRKFRVNSTQT